MREIVVLLAQFLAVMIVITLHEYAHARVACWCGDKTAKFSGRMTLNPAKHFDPIGVVMFAVTGFGWAKPVPVNPNNFKKYRSGAFWTSAAGIIMNYLTAFFFFGLTAVAYECVIPKFEGQYMELFLKAFFGGMVLFSLSFCIFNLLPVFPLDGFRMYDALAKKRGKVYWYLRQYGYYVLLGLILVHFLAGRAPILGYVDLLGYVLDFTRNIFGYPIEAFWKWFYNVCGKTLPIKM